jgi:hypothetical protein
LFDDGCCFTHGATIYGSAERNRTIIYTLLLFKELCGFGRFRKPVFQHSTLYTISAECQELICSLMAGNLSQLEDLLAFLSFRRFKPVLE